MNNKTLSKKALLSFLITSLLLTLLASCSRPVPIAEHTPEPSELSESPTAAPTDTAVPADKTAFTPFPTEPGTPDAEGWISSELRNRRDEFRDAAKAVLSGESDSDNADAFLYLDGTIAPGCCFMRRSNETGNEVWTAYNVCVYKYRSNTAGLLEERYIVEEPFKSFPSELELMTAKKLKEYEILLYGGEYNEEDHDFPLSDPFDFCMPDQGFVGDDWMLFTPQDPSLTSYVHVIWHTDDGENYCEFGRNTEFFGKVTGACILSKTTGFLCQTDRYAPNGAIGFKVFGTFDGGETWHEMDTVLPEEYTDYSVATAFFPYFEGERGVIFISISLRDGRTITRCFITENGGHTWTFKD